MSTIINMGEENENNIIEPILKANLNIKKWNSKIEKILKNILKKSNIYKKEHYKLAEQNDKYFSYLMITVIILTPIPALSSIIRTFSHELDILYILTSSITSFISGILLSILKFSNFKEQSNKHKTATIKYIYLVNNITRQLELYRRNRISAQEYLDWILKKYDELNSESPLICNIEEYVEDFVLTETDSDSDSDSDSDYLEEEENEKEKKLEQKISIILNSNMIDSSFDDKTMNYEISRYKSNI
jgi:hypothetical protein